MVMLLLILDDPWPPQTTPISTLCVAFRIFIVGKCRDFKFGRQTKGCKTVVYRAYNIVVVVGWSYSQPTNDKPPLKGTRSRHVTGHITWPILILLVTLIMERLKTSIFMVSISLRTTNCPWNGHVRTHVTNINWWAPEHNSGITETTVVKLCTNRPYIKLVVLRWPPIPSGCGRGHVTSRNFKK